MKEVTLHVQDKEYQFFMKLIKTLPFVHNIKPGRPPKKKALKDLQNSIDELKLIKAGKKRAVSAKTLLKEL